MTEYEDLSFCIPAYNEEASIAQVISDLKNHFPASEIIVVNDGSTDNTEDILKNIEGITVLTNIPNRGYGASIKRAMKAATREVVAWYDADGQHRVEDLKKVVQPVLDGEKDVVIGVRDKDSYVVKRRVVGKIILKFVAQLIARQKIPDLNSGLRCFRKDVIQKYLHLLPERFSASTVTTLIMIKRNYRIGYSSIKAEERVGTSTVRIFGDGLSAIKLMFHLLVLFEAFRFFFIISLALIIPGGIYGVYMAIVVGKGLPVFAGILVMCGVMTFLIGVVCDQVTELRKERFEN